MKRIKKASKSETPIQVRWARAEQLAKEIWPDLKTNGIIKSSKKSIYGIS
jgi:hypothetical protein